MTRTHGRLLVGLMALVLTLLVTACGTDALVNDVYPAAGDGTRPEELVKTTSFIHDDDLNVVVRLGTHTRTLEVSAIFTGPTGETFGTDTLEADETVGKVLLGLDWESFGSISWSAGEWQADIYIDNKLEKTVRFTVQPAPLPSGTAPAGG